MKRSLCSFFYFIAVLFSPHIGQAQQTAQQFVQTTNYLLYLPENYGKDTAARWPLLLFLHGSGESGTDVSRVALHGPPELVKNGKKFPFILLSPQSDKPSGWNTDMLYKLLQEIKQRYHIDPDRIYLSGLSMGGYGTWQLAMEHPEEFAAIAPVCAGGDTSNTWKIHNIPVWAFHGADDDVVLPVYGRNMTAAASRYNKNVRFTLYQNTNHNSWDTTYRNDSLYTWLLAQSKFSFREMPVSSTELKSYEGTFISERDTVKMKVSEDGLTAYPRNKPVLLKYGGNDMFFVKPGMNVEVRFQKINGTISGFLLLSDEKLFYRKLK